MVGFWAIWGNALGTASTLPRVPKFSLCSQAADIKVEVPTVTILTSQLLGHLYDSIYVFGPSVDGDAHVSGEKGLPVTDRCHSLLFFLVEFRF